MNVRYVHMREFHRASACSPNIPLPTHREARDHSLPLTGFYFKVCRPNSVTYLWVVDGLGADLRTDTREMYVSKRDRSTCSKLVNHFRLNSQQHKLRSRILMAHCPWTSINHNNPILGSKVDMTGEDLYNHLMSTRIFTLMMNNIFISAPKIMRQMAMSTIWIR